MDVASSDHGLSKWMRLLREHLQEPLGMIDEYQQKLLPRHAFRQYVNRIRTPTNDQTATNINKLFHGTAEIHRMCAQQMDSINEKIPDDSHRRSTVAGADGAFCFASSKNALQVHKAAKNIVSFIDDLCTFANTYPDIATLINKFFTLACFTTCGIECLNGITASISCDLTKACYQYAYARSRSVLRIYNMMFMHGYSVRCVILLTFLLYQKQYELHEQSNDEQINIR
eukprot:201929_1